MIFKIESRCIPLGQGLYAMRHLVIGENDRILECFTHRSEAEHFVDRKKEELTRDG